MCGGVCASLHMHDTCKSAATESYLFCSEREKLLGMSAISFITIFFLTR